MQGVNAEAGWHSRHQGAALCRNNHTVSVSRYKSGSQRRWLEDATTQTATLKEELRKENRNDWTLQSISVLTTQSTGQLHDDTLTEFQRYLSRNL